MRILTLGLVLSTRLLYHKLVCRPVGLTEDCDKWRSTDDVCLLTTNQSALCMMSWLPERTLLKWRNDLVRSGRPAACVCVCADIVHHHQCSGFFLFGLDLELFAKIRNNLVSTQSLKLFLLITHDLNKIKNFPNTFLQALLSRKRVQNFS